MMYIIFKMCLAMLSIAICGVAFHQVADYDDATRTGVTSAKVPGLATMIVTKAKATKGSDTSAPSAIDNLTALRDHLNSARAAAEAMPGYTAILEMQEEVDGTLRSVDRIKFKTRREPFSVYMRWDDSDQEALFVDGENDNRLIVKPTKGLAAIRRVWRLEPDCPMAMQNCRYPITAAGIENLAIRIQAFYSGPDIVSAVASCESSDSTVADREVTLFEVEFKDKKSVPDYCASRFMFDKQTQYLIAVDNYGWSDDRSPRLIEHYFYDQITVVPEPDGRDFAQENPAYAFKAR